MRMLTFCPVLCPTCVRTVLVLAAVAWGVDEAGIATFAGPARVGVGEGSGAMATPQRSRRFVKLLTSTVTTNHTFS